jgi:glycosyltransferase involved in cell wall biosynthesis
MVLSGLDLPKGSEELRPDGFYVCTNFVRDFFRRFPIVDPAKILVSHCGVNRWNWSGLFGPARDSRRLIYSSHPSKGLAPAEKITRKLRERDPRFALHWFGGNRLWGGADEPLAPEPGIVYGGMVNQRHIAPEYKRSAFALQLQTRLEPFGITIVEAMAAGCLVVASPVVHGANPKR